MNKNLFKYCFLLAFIIIGCCGCNGNVTRDIRHAGFSVGSTFKCDDFYPDDKDDTSYKKIKYFLSNQLIDENGGIYELSMGQLYQNKQNCKKADTDIVVKAIFDNKIVKGIDNKYYYLTQQNNVASYSEVTVGDNSYNVYDLLLRDEDVVKVMTADSSNGLYYVLKVDGNIYANVIASQDRNTPPVVVSTQVIYNFVDFGGTRIIDFSYEGDSLGTYIKTEESVYRMRVTNSKECTKYSDIGCIYQMQLDPIFDKYKDRILTFNGNILITDYKQVFTVVS
jgi:hypothetical protein